MGSSAPPTKRTRNNAGTASECISEVNSPQLLETRFEEQTKKSVQTAAAKTAAPVYSHYSTEKGKKRR